MSNKLDLSVKRHRVIQCYVKPDEKLAVQELAAAVGLSESDLVRLLLATATPEHIESLKTERGWLSLQTDTNG